MALALGVLLVASLVAVVVVPRILEPTPIVPTADGPIAFGDDRCGLVAVDPATAIQTVIAGPVDGCPGREQATAPFAGLSYLDVTGSADGRSVAYGRVLFCGGCVSTPTEAAVAAQGAYLFDRATGTTERLDDCRSERCWFRVATSPDGRYVAYTQSPYRVSAEPAPDPVTIVDRISGTRATWAQRSVVGLTWAHAGRSLAVIETDPCHPADMSACNDEDEVVVLSADARQHRSVATFDSATTVTWSADDRSLLTVSEGRDPAATPVGTVTTRRVDVATGRMTTLFTVPASYGMASWSPDGSRFVYQVTEASMGESVMVANVDGTARQLTHGLILTAPIWSPSGDSILMQGTEIPVRMGTDSRFRVGDEGPKRTGIFIIPVDGGAITMVAEAGDAASGWLAGPP